MITVESKGSFKNIDRFLEKMSKRDILTALRAYGQDGVYALSKATPVDTGLAASSWSYQVSKKRGRYTLSWHNTNIENGIPVVILIQYGHGTRSGSWVEGVDFINPVIQPLFDRIASEIWEEVKRA